MQSEMKSAEELRLIRKGARALAAAYLRRDNGQISTNYATVAAFLLGEPQTASQFSNVLAVCKKTGEVVEAAERAARQ